jgi:hypothetical protein
VSFFIDFANGQNGFVGYGHKGHITEWIPRILKSGKASHHTFDAKLIYFTPLYTCDICGKTSTPKNVNEKTDCASELWHYYTPKLCMPCWNHVRRISNTWRELQQLNDTIKRFLRKKFVMSEIKATSRTTETLRSMLFDAMEKVQAGMMDHNDAKNIAMLADRIIKSAELELKYSETVSRLDAANNGINPGPILLTSRKG